MTLVKLLASLTKKTTARTAAQLREDLGKIDIAALESRVAAIEGERHDLLLQGSDADLAKNRQALDAANLDVERARAGLDELNRQIADAERREGAAAIAARAAAAEKAADDLAATCDKIETANAGLNDLLGEAASLAATIAAWNRQAETLDQSRINYREPSITRQRMSWVSRH